MSNLSLWNSVCETNPETTKLVDKNPKNAKSRKFTAIDAYSQIMKATEKFGPIGKGWGYTVKKEVLEGCFLVELTLWYMLDDKRYDIPSIFEMVSLHGKYSTDNEAPKKAVTGALTKGLSYLGFNADVFLGKFDDNKYVESMHQKHHTDNLNNLINKVNELFQALPHDMRSDESFVKYMDFLNKNYTTAPNMDQKLNSCIQRLTASVQQAQRASAEQYSQAEENDIMDPNIS